MTARRSLADAEAAEDAIEHVLRVDGAGRFADFVQRPARTSAATSSSPRRSSANRLARPRHSPAASNNSRHRSAVPSTTSPAPPRQASTASRSGAEEASPSPVRLLTAIAPGGVRSASKSRCRGKSLFVSATTRAAALSEEKSPGGRLESTQTKSTSAWRRCRPAAAWAASSMGGAASSRRCFAETASVAAPAVSTRQKRASSRSMSAAR